MDAIALFAKYHFVRIDPRERQLCVFALAMCFSFFFFFAALFLVYNNLDEFEGRKGYL